MSDKFPEAEEDTNILEASNQDRDNLNIGNIVPQKTEAQILAMVSSTTDILVFNTTTNQLEFWHGTSDRRILA